MLNNIESMIQNLAGGSADPQAVEQAADEHLSSVDHAELKQQLQTAAQNAQQNGQPSIAQEISDMISRRQADPQALKSAAISYIRNNPQVLTHFAPPFAQGILNRMA